MEDAPDDRPPRLAVYGTLAPGRANHGQLADVPGRWFVGVVRGRLHDAGWGAAHGCPGLVLDDEGDDIEVHILESEHLAAAWPRLDAFEGAEYERVATDATSGEVTLPVFIYVLANR